MPPNQQVPPSFPSDGQNPYDFILQGPPKQKRSILPTGNSPKQRATLFMSLVGGVLLLFIIIMVLIFSSGGSSTKGLIKVAQDQTEILRITEIGTRYVRGSDAAAINENTKLTLTTAQAETVAYITKHNKKPSSKTLALGANKATDQALNTANSAGQFDDALKSTLKTQLTGYQSDLSTEYKATNSKSEKVLLKKLYDQATLLIKTIQ